MKNLCFSLVMIILILAAPAKSAEVGDIYYHDKTFSNKVDPDKVPIGVVFWVSPDNNFGLIVSLEQIPNKQGSGDANTYCSNFSTLGTKPGDWQLARVDDLLKLGNSYNAETNAMTTNLTKINNILNTITIASPLKSDWYIAYGGGYCVNLSSGKVKYGYINSTKCEVRCITGF